MKMEHNIYLIEATKRAEQPYDSYDSHVVIADKPGEVRKMCPSADEGEEVWLQSAYSTIKKVGESDLKKQVILSSFNAG